MSDIETYVITRTGKQELLDPNRITERLKKLISRAPKINHVNPYELMLNVTQNLRSNITTTEIDEYAGNAAASLSVMSPYYLQLAARIIIDNHQKNTSRSFVDKMRQAYLYKDENGKICPIISEQYFKYVEIHQDYLESIIDYSRDFSFDFFGFRTFQRIYGLKLNNVIIERPQDLFMRVAVALNMYTKAVNEEDPLIGEELEFIKLTYDMLSTKCYTQATPTLFNAGLKYNQYASCFLFGTEDSAEGIMKTATDCALTSKRGGGIGVHIHCWRGTGAQIRSTMGTSSGVIPFLKIFNSVMLAFNQGGKRPGSSAIYLMPHHPDIEAFLKLKLPTGNERERAHDLFYAVWLPNIFMERVRANQLWSLFDPDMVGDLSEFYNEEWSDEKNAKIKYDDKSYTAKYLKLEEGNKFVKQIPARQIWDLLYEANKIKGAIYICFSDHVNRMSMHKNIGTVKSSNLCVSGSTYVLTDKGYKQIKDLTMQNNGQHIIWNGKQMSYAQFAKTSDNAPLLEVVLSNGLKLKCTHDHQFNIIKNNKVITIKAKDMHNNNQLQQCEFPVVDHPRYTAKTLLTQIQTMLDKAITNDKFIVLEYSTYESALNAVFLLNMVACKAKIITTNSEPNTFNVEIHASNMSYLLSKNIKVNKLPIGRAPKDYNNLYVASIIEVNSEATYCFNEPKEHMGVFNGIYAHNCSEITLYSDHKEYAVCTLASISLPNCIVDKTKTNNDFPVEPWFDHELLMNSVKAAVINTNNIIDKNYYPTPEARRGSLFHRPVGIGFQGLADAYLKMRYPFGSKQARKLNKFIAETMYYAALLKSTELCREEYLALKKKCREEGSVTTKRYSTAQNDLIDVTYTNPDDIPKKVAAYPTIDINGGSPISHGKFHWELYGLTEKDLSGNFNWESLRERIKIFGVKNSLLIALMPTASTSSLLGNNECFEPYTSNIYKRTTLAGEFIMINKWLIHDLYQAGIWTTELKDYLLACEGSVQHIDGIPKEIKELYKTAWEIDQSELIQQAIDRQPFVDQAQSLNWYLERVTKKKFTDLAFQAWTGKLKTGKYYLHSKPELAAQKFSIAPELQNKMRDKMNNITISSNFGNPDKQTCDACSA